MKSRQQNSTSYPILILMVDSADHITGKTGLTVAVTLSKDGGAFAATSGAVTEIGSGWYALAGNATDRNTLGELAVHATATGADPFDDRYEITVYDPFVRVNANTEQWNGSAPDDLSSGKVQATASNLPSKYPASVDWSADVTNKPTIGTSTFNPATDTVARVALVDTCTTNTDMRGTDGAYTGTVPSAAAVSTQVASDLADAHGAGSWATATSVTVSDKTGFKLSSDGLDAIAATEPTQKPTTFVGWIMWLVQRVRCSRMTASQFDVLTEAGEIVTTQDLSDDNTTQSIGAPQ